MLNRDKKKVTKKELGLNNLITNYKKGRKKKYCIQKGQIYKTQILKKGKSLLSSLNILKYCNKQSVSKQQVLLPSQRIKGHEKTHHTFLDLYVGTSPTFLVSQSLGSIFNPYSTALFEFR